MVGRCCVPLCNSRENRKEKVRAVSFHEIPSNMELRTEWLRRIHRPDDWIPQDTARVCSLHFLPEDFRVGLKVIRLKPDAVPTVFKDFPSYLQKEFAKKTPRKPPKVRAPLPKKPKNVSDKPVAIANGNVSDGATNGSTDTCGNKESIISKTTKKNIRTEARKLMTVSEACQTLPPPLETKETQTWVLQVPRGRQGMSAEELRRKLRNSNRMVWLLKRKNEALKKEVQKRDFEAEECERDLMLQQVAAIRKDVTNNVPSAIFLMDQLRGYSKKRFTWNKKTIQYCLNWRLKNESGYKFLRNSELVKLPGRSTLSKHLDATNAETHQAVAALVERLPINEIIPSAISVVSDE